MSEVPGIGPIGKRSDAGAFSGGESRADRPAFPQSINTSGGSSGGGEYRPEKPTFNSPNVVGGADHPATPRRVLAMGSGSGEIHQRVGEGEQGGEPPRTFRNETIWRSGEHLRYQTQPVEGTFWHGWDEAVAGRRNVVGIVTHDGTVAWTDVPDAKHQDLRDSVSGIPDTPMDSSVTFFVTYPSGPRPDDAEVEVNIYDIFGNNPDGVRKAADYLDRNLTTDKSKVHLEAKSLKRDADDETIHDGLLDAYKVHAIEIEHDPDRPDVRVAKRGEAVVGEIEFLPAGEEVAGEGEEPILIDRLKSEVKGVGSSLVAAVVDEVGPNVPVIVTSGHEPTRDAVIEQGLAEKAMEEGEEVGLGHEEVVALPLGRVLLAGGVVPEEAHVRYDEESFEDPVVINIQGVTDPKRAAEIREQLHAEEQEQQSSEE